MGERYQEKLKILVILVKKFASAYIRILNPLDELARKGLIEYRFIIADDLNEEQNDFNWSDIIILQRVVTIKGLEVVHKAISNGKPVIFDIDDNLIDKLPTYHPHRDFHSNILARRLIKLLVKNVDLVTVSTNALKERFSCFNNVKIIPNTINFSFITNYENKMERIKIGYTGSETHAKDCEVIVPAIKRIAEEYKNKVSFYFMGYLPGGLEDIEGLEVEKYEDDYISYLKKLGSAGIDIGLAPLVDNKFNKYKSNIKFLDYSALKIPGVYSKCHEYENSVKDGVTGLLVENTEQSWYEAIKHLTDNPELRGKMAQKAYEDVRENFNIGKACEAWEKVFTSLSNRKGISRHLRIIKLIASHYIFVIVRPFFKKNVVGTIFR